MFDPAWSSLHQALSSGARSTVLKPLGWLTALMLVGTISGFRLGVPSWFATTLAVLCITTVVTYLMAYIYFAFTDRDALRSERYSIQKLAIQKGFIGDDQTGYVPLTIDAPTPSSPPALTAGSKSAEESQS